MESKYDNVMQLLSLMRATQKEFFRTRSQIILQRSKEIERLIDDEIAKWERERNEKQEPTLNL